jgi:hypothetical protein
MDDMIPGPTSPFEAIRRTDEAGDYWTARELMPLLEYSTWQKFEEALQRAMTDCAKAGRDVKENSTPAVNVSVKRGPKQKDYRGRKSFYKGDLPPAMTATELALNALASTVARQLHVSNDSLGFGEIASDVDTAGRIVGDTRRQIEAATGRPVVSPRNLLRAPDGGLWALAEPDTDPGDPT